MASDQQLAELSLALGQHLLQQNARVTAAESCTGGWIAKVLTDIAGSSAWFHRGFVTYSNEAKEQMIGVQHASLTRFGAVSEQVVLEMARGALETADADYAVAVSGIAGPDGGSPEKPVGTVWFGFASRGQSTRAIKHIFQGDREGVRRQSVAFALTQLLSEINQNRT